MKGMLRAFRAKRQMKQDVHHLYTQLVNQARQPALYKAPYNIDDTIDGRFSLILLHLFIVDQSMVEAEANNEARRMLQETMVNDIDRSLRELGVGDMSVGKEMKRVGATLLGCMKSYRDAMVSDDKVKSLSDAIRRNITDDDASASALAVYTIDTLKHLSKVEIPDDIYKMNIFSSTVNTENSAVV